MSIARKLLSCAMLLAMPALAQQGGDLQAQILYSFQIEDTNGLANLIQGLHTQIAADGADRSLRYHVSHAQYRLGLVAGSGGARVAEAAFGDCIDELKPLVREDVKSAEALALQSACYAKLAGLRTIESVLLRAKAADRLKAALDLAPRNPRVLYVSAVEDLARAKRGTVEHQSALARLQRAVEIFEESSATAVDAPGWGHAEAYLAMGRELQLQGDQLGARNWIEKSLIAAPDYKAAQRQLASLVRP